ETLGELTRERLFERVLLRGLSRNDVERFIEMVSGIVPPRGLVQAVYTQTEGNPLFVTEVVRLLVQEGELSQEATVDRESWDVRIPEGVREVIGRRLNRLTDRCNQTLTIAAVIGREFEMRQLSRLVDDSSAEAEERMSDDRLLEVLEEGLKARVIEEMPDGIGVYQFTHALIQQTLFNELTTTRRVRLHARIIEVFEDLYKDSIETHAVDLAYHAAEAEAMLGSEKLVRYSKMAGDRALAGYAYEDASNYLQRALTAKQDQPMDAETAEIMSGLGSAQLATGKITEAVSNLSKVFDYYVESGETDKALAIVEPTHSIEFIVGMADAIARAVELAPPDSQQAGRVLSNHGYILGYSKDGYESAKKAFDTALAIARRLGDTTLELRTLANYASIEGVNLQLQKCLEKCLAAIRLSEVVDDPYSKLRAHLWASMSFYVTGEPDNVPAHAEEMVKTAEALRDRLWLARSKLPTAMLAASRGDWEAARNINDQVLSDSAWGAGAAESRALIEFETGNSEAGQAYLDQFAKHPDIVSVRVEAMVACVIPIAGRITGRADQFDVAEAAARAFRSMPYAAPHLSVMVEAGLALISVERSDAKAAAERYSALEPRTGQFGIFVPIAFDRVLGLLAHTMGNFDISAGHFEDALAFCRKAGYATELAWPLCDYADILPERDAKDDKAKATSVLDESLRISTDLGMRHFMERVLSRRDILKA
ncbi:MAG: hypothetical protein IIC22_08415, partial [Chloroflexi bacterium]|nr:hypothetical protein [Chloroflexota bacterium]